MSEKMIRIIAATVFVATLGVILTLGYAATRNGEPASYLPPCLSEDSTNCIWDATTSGNGQGTSFIDYNGQTYFLGE